MYYLPEAVPFVRLMRMPFSRDQFMLLMAAVNEIFLGVDIYFAHSMRGTITPNEWIPIIFGPVAGALLLLSGIAALRNRPLATVFATFVFIASIVVGLLGAYFHLHRALLPSAPAGEQVTLNLLVWAPPILGPLTFSLVGLLGISAAWVEDPPDSGNLLLLGGRRVSLPYSKTRAYFFMIALGILATVISSVMDHARTHFINPWLWVPTVTGVFATVVVFAAGAYDRLRRADLFIYITSMLLLILVGVLGSVLHISQNLTAQNAIVGERFLNGAPFMAPLLFANMGALGLLVLLDPSEIGNKSSPIH